MASPMRQPGVQAARRTVLLVDRSRIGADHMARFGDIGDVDVMITESDLDDETTADTAAADHARGPRLSCRSRAAGVASPSAHRRAPRPRAPRGRPRQRRSSATLPCVGGQPVPRRAAGRPLVPSSWAARMRITSGSHHRSSRARAAGQRGVQRRPRASAGRPSPAAQVGQQATASTASARTRPPAVRWSMPAPGEPGARPLRRGTSHRGSVPTRGSRRTRTGRRARASSATRRPAAGRSPQSWWVIAA